MGNYYLLDETNKLLKATEVAAWLNISKAYAYRLMQTGEIRTVKIGSARRVRPKDLQVYVEDNLSKKESY